VIEADAGAGPIVATSVDHVVAAADLHMLSDGTFAAAVELWNAGSWRVGVVWTGARAPLLWDLGAPPAGMTPPLAQPRFALSDSVEPAVAFRAPSVGGGWELRLGTATTAPQVVAPAAGLEQVVAWASPSTPAAVWLASDHSGVESSLGPVRSGGFQDTAVLAKSGGGLLVAAATGNRIAIWALGGDGAVGTLIDRSVDAYLAGTLHGVQGTDKFYYLGYVTRAQHEQGYTLAGESGALPRAVAVPTPEPLDAVVAGFGLTWLVAPIDEVGGHGLGVMLQGTSPPPFPVAHDGPDEKLAVEPLAVIGDGVVTLAIVRAGLLSIDTYFVQLACR